MPPKTTPKTKKRQPAKTPITREAIVAAARDLLNNNKPLGLRAIANTLNVTAPALYRYVESLDELRCLVAAECLHDTLDKVEEDVKPWLDNDDPLAASVVGTITFRHWALTHPGEYRAFFETSHAYELTTREDIITGREEAQARFIRLFGVDIFAGIWRVYDIQIPDESTLRPEILDAIVNHEPWMPGAPADADPVFQWGYQRAWHKLVATITQETYDMVPQVLVDTASHIVADLREIGHSLGLTDEVERATNVAFAHAAALMERDQERIMQLRQQRMQAIAAREERKIAQRA